MIFLWSSARMTFFEVPKASTGFVRDGQKYLYRGTWLSDEVEGKKTKSRILIWDTKCPDCGDEFSVTTGVKNVKPPARRCPLHEVPTEPVTKKAATKRKRAFQKNYQVKG